MLSHGCGTGGSERAAATMQEDSANFAIQESICHLSFRELPITKRLANVALSIPARTLGDLNGRSPFELLQYKACGWRTISEIQQLIERAVSGEFDVGHIEETTAAAELLRLLEQGLPRLPLRGRQFLLARIGAEIGSVRSPRADLPSPSYAEIGRQYGLTRARVHKVFGNTLDCLRKSWGPRVPRLLEIIKWRCLSMICPLTPELLRKWTDSSVAVSAPPEARGCFNKFQFSMNAHVRLISLLDKGVPCWRETKAKTPLVDKGIRQFDLALADVVREAGGQISVADAYHRLSHRTEQQRRSLTIENFLRMLHRVEGTAIDFEDPQSPIIRLCTRNGANIRVHIVTNREANQFFNNGFCERRAVAMR
jgi:hypothetical protein